MNTLKRNAYLVPVLIFPIVYIYLNWGVIGPHYGRDELSIIGKAITLAGYAIPQSGPKFFAGYSILVTPLVWVADSPEMLWRLITIFNSALFLISFLFLNSFLKRYFSEEKKLEIGIALAIVALFPTWAVMAGYSFPFPGSVFFYMLALFLLMKWDQKSIFRLAPFSFAVGFLCWIHPTGMVVAVSSSIIILLASINSKKASFAIIHLCIVSVLILVYQAYIHGAINSLYSEAVSLGPKLDSYERLTSRVQGSISAPSIEIFIGAFRFFGSQTANQIYASFGLLIFAVLYMSAELKATLAKRALSAKQMVFLFILISFFFSLILSSLTFALTNPRHYSGWFYGRYIDRTALPLLAVGYLVFKNFPLKKRLQYFLIFTIFFIVLAYIIESAGIRKMPGPVSLASFWPFFIDNNIRTGWNAYQIVLYGSIGLLLALSLDRRFLIILMSLSFILCTTKQISRHQVHMNSGVVYAAINYIVDNTSKGDCIAYGASSPKTFFRVYDYNPRRLSPEEWNKNCDGPYIFPLKEDLAEGKFDYKTALVVENSAKMILLKKDLDIDWYRRQLLEKKRLFIKDKNSFFLITGSYLAQHKRTGKWEDKSLHTSNKRGILFSGPYRPVPEGQYLLKIYGKFKNTNGAVLKVVDSEAKKNLQVRNTYELCAFDCTETSAVIPLNIKTDISKVQFKLYVTEETEISILYYDLVSVPKN